MATLKDVVDIFETTAQAMAGLNGYIYGNRSEININDEKQYPLVLVDRNVQLRSFDLTKGRKEYAFLFQFCSLFHRDLEAQENDQDVQHELLKIAQQYLSEIQRRFVESRRIKIVNDTFNNGDFAFMYANDRLLRLQFTVPIEVFDNSCVTGVFNYGAD